MQSFEYRVVDVFTERALEGNALAVFLDGAGLDDGQMQRIARELNLSETVFVVRATRSDCVARLRIFTPMRELAFAGHPTVGTSFVLLDEGMAPAGSERFLLEEQVGPVPVRVEAGARPLIWLTTPQIQDGPVRERELCARVLGLQADAWRLRGAGVCVCVCADGGGCLFTNVRAGVWHCGGSGDGEFDGAAGGIYVAAPFAWRRDQKELCERAGNQDGQAQFAARGG